MVYIYAITNMYNVIILAAAMKLLCITNIGSISSKKIIGVKKCCKNGTIEILFIANLQKYMKCTGQQSG